MDEDLHIIATAYFRQIKGHISVKDLYVVSGEIFKPIPALNEVLVVCNPLAHIEVDWEVTEEAQT